MYPVGKTNALQNFLIAFGQGLAQQKMLSEERAREDEQRKQALAAQDAANLLPFIRDDLGAIDKITELTLGSTDPEAASLAEDAGKIRKSLMGVFSLPPEQRTAAYQQLQQDTIPRLQQRAGVIQAVFARQEEARKQSGARFNRLVDSMMNSTTDPELRIEIGMADSPEKILALGGKVAQAALKEAFSQMSPEGQWIWTKANGWLDATGKRTDAAPAWFGDSQLAGVRAGKATADIKRTSALQTGLFNALEGVDYTNDAVIKQALGAEATADQVLAGINQANALKAGAKQNEDTQQFIFQMADAFSRLGMEMPKEFLDKASDPNARGAMLAEFTSAAAQKAKADKDQASAAQIVGSWRGIIAEDLRSGLDSEETAAKANAFLAETDPVKALDKLMALQQDAGYQSYVKETGAAAWQTKRLALEQQKLQVDLSRMQITQIKKDDIAKYAATTDPKWFDNPGAIKYMKENGFTDGQIASMKSQAVWRTTGSPEAVNARTEITLAFGNPPPMKQADAQKFAESLKAAAKTSGLNPDQVYTLYMSYWADTDRTRGIQNDTLRANLAQTYAALNRQKLTGVGDSKSLLDSLRKVQSDINTQLDNIRANLKKDLTGTLYLDEKSYKDNPAGLKQLQEYNRLTELSKAVGAKILEAQGLLGGSSASKTGGSSASKVDALLKKDPAWNKTINDLLTLWRSGKADGNKEFNDAFARFLAATGLSEEEGLSYLKDRPVK